MPDKRQAVFSEDDPWQSGFYRQTRLNVARQRDLYFRQVHHSTPAMPPFIPGSFVNLSSWTSDDDRE